MISKELPRLPKTLDEISLHVPTEIFDDKGEVLIVLGGINRVPLEAVSSNFKKAILSAEDKNFFSHHGIDKAALLRAVLNNISAGRVVQGASTITQQLTKNLFFSFERTFQRKLFELLIALQFEAAFSKEEILEVYCNQIYFGAGAYGVEDASRTYFGKHASELSISEASLLAGIPKSPTFYNPFRNPENAKKRQSYVLEKMFENGIISEDEKKHALEEPLKFAEREGNANQIGYFIQYILKEAAVAFGAEAVNYGGLKIYTTLDRRLQSLAWDAVQGYLPEIDGLLKDKNGASKVEGALVAVEPGTGWLKAMVGGRNYSESQYNRATANYRQPGSGFKPFVYYTALEKLNYLPSTVVEDEPFTVEIKGSSPWSPENFGGGNLGPIILKQALMKSINVVSAKLIVKTGVESVISTARKLGIKSQLPSNFSLALGACSVSPLEMASAFSALAMGGRYAEPVAIKKIMDNRGNVLLENIVNHKQVLDPQKTYMLIDMLKGVLTGGTAAGAKGLGWTRPAIGKTGTTNDSRDAWFTGFTPTLGASVWVGYDDNQPMIMKSGKGLTGGRGALPVWTNFMLKAMEGEPVGDFPIPRGIEFIDVDPSTGKEADALSEVKTRVAVNKKVEDFGVYYQTPDAGGM